MNLSQVLAGIPEQQISALIKLLFAACAVEARGETTPAIESLSTAAMAAAKKAAIVLESPNVLTYLIAICKGTKVDHDDFVHSIKELRAGIRAEIKNDASLQHILIDQLAASTAYLVNHGEPALKKVRALAVPLAVPAITEALIVESGSQADYVKPLQKIVKALTKGEGTALTAEDVAKLKEKKPEVHAEYLRLRREFNQVWKDELRNFVFASKKTAVKFRDVLAYFKSKNIEHTLPDGYDGLIDANGKLYTTTGKAINGVPGVGFSVRMNPRYDPKTDNEFVFTTVNKEGKVSQYVYTMDYRKKANKEKFQKVENLDKVIDGIHKKWVTHLRKGTQEPEVVASTVLELLYMFSARVGSMGNAAHGESTFGIVTLLARHFQVKGTKILITYKGKDGVTQKHLIDGAAGAEARMLVKNIKLYLENKGPEDRVFTYDFQGKQAMMTGEMVNKWFKKLGSPVTVHKLRHVRGTELFAELLKSQESEIFEREKPMSQAEADTKLKQLAEEVGKMLGHVRGVGMAEKATGATALANYISPELMVAYYERLKLRVPKFLEKVVHD